MAIKTQANNEQDYLKTNGNVNLCFVLHETWDTRRHYTSRGQIKHTPLFRQYKYAGCSRIHLTLLT